MFVIVLLLTPPHVTWEQDVERIFGNLTELHELSIKLLGDLDDCIEMSGEIGGMSSVAQAGIIFEDLAEVRRVQCVHVCACVCIEKQACL